MLGIMIDWRLVTACTLVYIIGIHAALAEETPLKINITKGLRPPEIDSQHAAEQQIEAVPGNASVISDTEWNSGYAATVKDVVRYTPGVLAQPRNGAESQRLSVRGSGLASNFQGRGLMVLQDGVPLNAADGSFEFPAIDPWLIRYAEIYPGANGLAYGASTLGGAINFVTPNGQTSPGAEIRGEIGSFGTLHEQLSYGRQWEKGDLYISASGYDQDGFRDNNHQRTSRLNGNWGWSPSADLSNRLYISQTDSDPQIPGTLRKSEISDDPTRANPNNVNGHYARDLDITRIGNKTAWKNDDSRVEATVFYTHRKLDNPVTTYEFATNTDVGGRFSYAHDTENNKWLTGINLAYGDSDETRFQNINGLPGAPILTRNLYATTSEWYGQLEHQLNDHFFVIGGLQISYATRDVEERQPTLQTQEKEYAGVNPRIGFRVDVTPSLQLFTNLSGSFEPPSFGELSGGNNPGFNDLKAQHGTTAEIGARGDKDGLKWSAAYYHAWLTNELVNYRFADSSTATINIPRSKRDGVELSLSGDIAKNVWSDTDAVTMRTAYTYSHFTLDHDALYGNNIIPGIPAHIIQSEIMYHHPSGVSLGPNVEWVPQAYPIDLTNSFSADSYAIFGARAAWDSKDTSTTLYIDARNLLNKKYIATANAIPDAAGLDGRNFYPGDGRAVYAGMRYRF